MLVEHGNKKKLSMTDDITHIKGTMITAARSAHMITRNSSHFKEDPKFITEIRKEGVHRERSRQLAEKAF